MTEKSKDTDGLMRMLQERAKELKCLYKIEEILNRPDIEIEEACKEVITSIPPGWQYPEICEAKITLDGLIYTSKDFRETPWCQRADIIVQDQRVGEISVYYKEEVSDEDDGPFLKEETKLLRTIAERLGHFIMYKRMQKLSNEYRTAEEDILEHKTPEWKVILNLLRQTDKNLYTNISLRMLYQLCWSGIDEAEQLLRSFSEGRGGVEAEFLVDENRPLQKRDIIFTNLLSDETFIIASKHISSEQILSYISKWIQEDRLSFLYQLSNQNPPLSDVVDAIQRYRHIAPEGIKLPENAEKGIKISLIRRLLSDQIKYINIAKKHIEIDDFNELLDHIIYSSESYGRLGGKSAGLFLAKQIIKRSPRFSEYLKDIKVPRTWYIPSDVLLSFLNYNNLTEVAEHKYKDIYQIRVEYPRVVQTFKNGSFPQDIIQGLSLVLDELKDKPLIVRSSSLLEDRAGSAFAGKYRSLFISNHGSKNKCLEELTDAIAEVYASTYGPDPIEYRAERGLLDFSEEMGIMIQEVVGTKIGDYFFPSFAGVAFSMNEFRWSPRINREDGLLRVVPGLGTRAVDRVSEDYPILIAPRQPSLRINVTLDEIIRYSPKKIDVINLKTDTFETVDIDELLEKVGDNIPGIEKIVSIFDGQHIRKPLGKNINFGKDDLIVTFDGLVTDTQFVNKINSLLRLLEDELETPVDIEFASDGKDFYLLQCRPQSYTELSAPVSIPKDVSKDSIIFTANRYVSNGRVGDIKYIVYVDPQGYDELFDQNQLTAVGRAVGRLNTILPKREFILMGPGRWGSRGDIKLGVRVIYSDINNTAVLIEIARKKGSYLPDLSFGTHFFQDLVEAGIRYLPLYPDDNNIIFNERFLKSTKNILPEILPEFEFLSNVVRVIDVQKATGGLVLHILMNADLDEAVGILGKPTADTQATLMRREYGKEQVENHWAWRLQMAEYIASQLDPDRFGVKGFYVFGSTKNANAGPGSDIDILIHFTGTEKQREELMFWLEGWSLCIARMNYLRTGYKSKGLLDVHIVTDEDIVKKTSYAAKIGAVTDAAKPLEMMKKIDT